MALKRNPEAMRELRVDVKNQEQWEELMAKEGLIDAYAGWCGPCKAIESTFRRMRNETGDDLLHFAMAETDNIDSLEAYRDKSKPTFLFFGGGELVHVIRGCDAPCLIRSITNFLREEHRILSGDAERKVFVDVEVQQQQQKEEEEKQDQVKEEEVEEDEEIEIVEVPKEISVVIIKPDALKNGHADEIIQNIEANGVEILHREEKVLTKEEAAQFYKQHEGSEHFEQLIDFMSSDPVLTLVLSKKGDDPGYGLIPEVRDLIGPKDVNLAKEEAPQSIRAQYGTDAIMNAVHSCDSSESAARELAFFFPDFNVPIVQEKRKKKRIQRTLALIRPGAYAHRKESILQKVTEAGFSIAMSKEMYLTREQAEQFYEDHKDKDYFESLVTTMTSGPSLALCLAREDAVEAWRNLLGPKDVLLAKEEAPESLRAVFAEEDTTINPLHGADTIEAAEKELRAFFPPQATVGVIKPEVYGEPEHREEIVEKIKAAGFKISAQKEIHLTKELAAQFYKEHEGKEFFEGLTDYMSSGPTLFMILSREDAVSGFRALVGPTEPAIAKEQAPNSLRALFATDPMKNAIHSSSNPETAVNVIHEFFPEIELNEDGTVKEPEKEPAEQESEADAEVENGEGENEATEENVGQGEDQADESGLERKEDDTQETMGRESSDAKENGEQDSTVVENEKQNEEANNELAEKPEDVNNNETEKDGKGDGDGEKNEDFTGDQGAPTEEQGGQNSDIVKEETDGASQEQAVQGNGESNERPPSVDKTENDAENAPAEDTPDRVESTKDVQNDEETNEQNGSPSGEEEQQSSQDVKEDQPNSAE